MKNKTYLFPLMMLSVAAISLSACDDKKAAEDQAAAQSTTEAVPAVATITASNATAFATAEGATTGAVFLTLDNAGTEADRLIAITSDKFSAIELHESAVDAAGVMEMRKVNGIDVAAGGKAELKAGGNHIMLMDLTAPLVEGSTFNITLDFEKGADVVVPVSVVAAGAPEAAAPMAAPQEGAMSEPTAAPVAEEAAPAAPSDAAATPAATTPDELPAAIVEEIKPAVTDAVKDAMPATDAHPAQ